MATCEFTELPYSPKDDSIVNNVKVSATKPTVAWGHNAGVSSEGARVQSRMVMMGGIVLASLFWVI